MKKKRFNLRPPGWTDLEEWQFNALWEIHPPRRGRKNGKAYAREVFHRISPGEKLFVEIMDAEREQSASYEWRKDDGQYVPDLSTWLNQQRWEDEIIR